MDKKSLIIYFSRADENYAVGKIEKGNTEVIAEYIQEFTGAEKRKVEPLHPYSEEYDVCTGEAKERQQTHDAPIVEGVGDISDYDIIYIGSPVYWDYLPEEMVTALKDLEWYGKVVRPFTTHEGSGLAAIPRQLASVCVGAQIQPGLAIKGTDVYEAKDRVKFWLHY